MSLLDIVCKNFTVIIIVVVVCYRPTEPKRGPIGWTRDQFLQCLHSFIALACFFNHSGFLPNKTFRWECWVCKIQKQKPSQYFGDHSCLYICLNTLFYQGAFLHVSLGTIYVSEPSIGDQAGYRDQIFPNHKACDDVLYPSTV